MAGRTTIRDVAKAAGVSLTAVSHALNGKGRLDPRTRERIQATADRLGYQANRLARGLRSGRYGAHALWLPAESASGATQAIALEYYMRLASAVTQALFSRGDLVILIPPGATRSGLLSVPVDGAIVVDPKENDPRIEALQGVGVPFVTIERNPLDPGNPWCVTSDMGRHVETLLDHLTDEGAGPIAILVPVGLGSWATEQRCAYLAWCERRERPPLERLVTAVNAFDGTRRAVAALLGGPEQPDAIVFGAERFVPGAMRAIAEAELHAPDDLLLAVAVDGNLARNCSPPLTAVDLEPERQAREAAEMLRGRLDGDEPIGPRSVQGTLLVRASSSRSRAAGLVRFGPSAGS